MLTYLLTTLLFLPPSFAGCLSLFNPEPTRLSRFESLIPERVFTYDELTSDFFFLHIFQRISSSYKNLKTGISVQEVKFKFEENRLALYSDSGELMGNINYHIYNNGTYLSIDYMTVQENFRQQGLSELLLGSILLKNPSIHKIGAALGETNRDIFTHHYWQTGNKILAFQQTPAYKIRKIFGFSEIDLSESTVREAMQGPNIQLVVRRPLNVPEVTN